DRGGGAEGAAVLVGGALVGAHRRGHDARLPRRRPRQGGAPRGPVCTPFLQREISTGAWCWNRTLYWVTGKRSWPCFSPRLH
ncbi:hypothetical protein DKP78_15550, partial [Enterococcus faecium]